jgi:TetR/AcrR family transcriptional repressor of lmrAB and yxaGH operons
VAFAGDLVRRSLQALAERGESPGALLRAYATQLAGWMAQSGYRDGCPIATVLLEAATDEPAIRAAGAKAGADWTRILDDVLRRHGVAPRRARRLAVTAIAALEGSLIQVRVAADTTPILEVAEEIAALFDAAVAQAASAPPPGGA